jgi:O-antigen ligase
MRPGSDVSSRMDYPQPDAALRWQRAGLVLGVLAGAAAFGVLVVKLPARFGPLAVLAAAAVPLAAFAIGWLMGRREWIPAVILVAAAFSPLALPTGTGSSLTDSFLLALLFSGLWVFGMVAVERRLSLVPTWLNVPLLIFMVLTFWSVLWSVIFRDPGVYVNRASLLTQLASATTNVMLPAALLMVVNFVHDVRMLKVLVGLMLAAGVVGLPLRYGLLQSPVEVVNYGGLFNMWVVILAGGLALFARHWKWYWRAVLGGLAGLYVYWGFILHIGWLAGWLPGLVGLGLLIWRCSRRLALLALAVAAIFVVTNLGFLESALQLKNAVDGGSRLSAWLMNWSITKDHLLFGTGPAGYAAYYMSYFPRTAMATHSTYIDLLAQNGILGAVPCLIFFLGVVWTGWKVSVRVKGRGDFVEALAQAGLAGTVACMVAMALGDWLFPFAYTQTITSYDYEVYSWLFMGAVLVLERLTRPSEGVKQDA